MRPSSQVAHPDEDGVERFRVYKPVDFSLAEAAYAMHAVVDPDLAKLGARQRVGRSRVPVVLRTIARDGWPSGFRPRPDRVAYWRRWLLEEGVYTVDIPEQEGVALMTDVNLWVPDGALYPQGYRASSLNQKGGVGKTALIAGTAGALAMRGWRVLLVDMDPQGHLTTEALGLREVPEKEPDLAAALCGEYTGPIEDLIVTHSRPPGGGRIDIIRTTLDMMTVIKAMYRSRMRMPERQLDDLLNQLPEGKYDFVLTDCPPSLDLLTDNALAASQGVLIPVQLARTSMRALRLLLAQIEALEDELRLPKRTLIGMVPGLYRRPLSGVDRYIGGQLEELGLPAKKEASEEQSDGDKMEPLPILAHLPDLASVKEAWLEGRTLPEFQPKHELSAQLHRIALRLEVEAGLAPASDWEKLQAEHPLPSLAPLPTKEDKKNEESGRA
ncbi:AAA family ATPase (plasmid) [Amycolatopsis sp. FU40]|uniref:ParA family protein n=1 Tax=Amycolatopsis sp. FU40 TaxID=2914159 RepID=UPI001F20C8C7|nr:AAA family ATPase [Amycolatopsis sp. FU40]UKD50827.1 AAA family ATPase [Amycolatopsis sp. FU40]